MYYKTIGETEFIYDEDEHKLFRFDKRKNDWSEIDINHTSTKTHTYKKIGIDTKYFKLHRVIYYICNDDFDLFDLTFIIDHADLNKGNNILSNLSKRTYVENNQHSTCKGISLEVKHNKTKEPHLFFRVSWNVNKKQYVKLIKDYWMARWVRAIKIQKHNYYRGTS